MTGEGAARGGAAPDEMSGAFATGLVARLSPSVPLRLPNTLYSIPAAHLLRSFSIKDPSNEPFGFLVSLRPVNRCAICRNISEVR